MIRTLLCVTTIMRLTIGIDIVEWSSHNAGHCGNNCDPNQLLNGNIEEQQWWNAAGANPEWVIFDMGSDVLLSRFDIMSMGDVTHDPKDFKLYYSATSDKNGVWTELLSGTGASGTKEWQEFPITTTVSARYYQWEITTRYSQYQGVYRQVNFEYATPNQRDCSVLAIDEFLLQCSTEFPTTQQQVTDLENRLGTLETNLQAQVTQNAGDITQLQNDLTNGNTGTSAQIQQLQTDVDSVNSRIDLFAAKSPGVFNIDGNNGKNIGLNVKDSIIIFVLIANLIAMSYIYCYRTNTVVNYKQHAYDTPI